MERFSGEGMGVIKEELRRKFGSGLGDALFDYVHPRPGAGWDEVATNRTRFIEAAVKMLKVEDTVAREKALEALSEAVERQIAKWPLVQIALGEASSRNAP